MYSTKHSNLNHHNIITIILNHMAIVVIILRILKDPMALVFKWVVITLFFTLRQTLQLTGMILLLFLFSIFKQLFFRLPISKMPTSSLIGFKICTLSIHTSRKKSGERRVRVQSKNMLYFEFLAPIQ